MTDDRTFSLGPDDARTLPTGPEGAPSAPEDIGTVIGPYRLVRRLGEGGMGEVFEAEQTEPIRRRVALKVIKQGMDTRAVVARFDAERQALALMDHPCIARVFDAGATVRGRPFFVMEYVEGEPITDYCNRRRLSTRERLELFVRVCAGVQHAHQKAVIHRDLKPSNILVGEVDGRPSPKIIDFGVAKATTRRLTEMTMFTEQGALVGTPEYMSPEQAALADDDIDTRTDVYALGVVLYELLVGSLPFESRELRKAGYDEIRRIIREQDPPRPSTRFGSLGDRATAVAETHGSAPKRLRSDLRGDLDWITMKALEKDRDRRYETATGLAADVQRHLRSEPVTAGPPSASYRLGKLVRRNRGAFAAGGALVLMLAALAVTMTVQAGRLARERDRTAVQAAKAERTTGFLQSMLGGITPATARGRDTKLLEEILANTARRTRAELANQPEVEAAIRGTLGTTYSALGRFPEAAANLQRADSLQTALLGPASVTTLTTRRLLGVTAARAGRHAESEAQLRAVLDAAQRQLGPDDPVTLATMVDLGDLLGRVGKFKEGIEVCEAAVAGLGRSHKPDPEELLRAKTVLAVAYYRAQRLDEAIALATEVLTTRAATLGDDHPLTLTVKGTLAYFLEHAGQGEEAARRHQEVVATAIRIYGPDHPETIKLRNNQAVCYNGLGRFAEAEAVHRELVAVNARIFGPENPETLLSMMNLGRSLTSLRRYPEAESLLDQTLEISRRTLGADHARTISTLGVLATLYDEQRRFRESAAMLGLIAGSSRRLYGDDNPAVVINYYNWGAKLQDMGDNRAAEPAFRLALDLHEHAKGGDQPYIAAAMNALGKALGARGDPAGCDSLQATGLAMRRRLFGNINSEVAWSLHAMGDARHERGDHAAAVPLLRECVAIRDSVLSPDDWQRWGVRSDLGRCLVDLGRFGEAIPFLETAVKGLSADPYTRDLANAARGLLATARRKQGR
jgi:non-specific serine/threonine protein kinase/serine/threonine-protein kinase